MNCIKQLKNRLSIHFYLKKWFYYLKDIYSKYSFRLHCNAFIFLSILTLQILLNNFLVRVFGFGLTPYRFTDLWLMTKFSSCFHQINWQIYEFKLNDECYNYYYGKPFIYLMDVLNVNFENYQWSGWIQIGMLAYFLAFMYESLIKNYSLKIVIAMLLSPPVFLLASLGNSDIIVIFVVFIAIRILREPKYILIGFFLISFVTLIKLYTLPVLFLYMTLIRIKAQQIISYIFFTCVVFSVLDSQNSVGSSALQRLNYNSSFGISVFGSWFAAPQVNPPFHSISPFTRWILGFILLILLLKICHHFLSKFQVSFPSFNKNDMSKYHELVLVSLICVTLYIVGTSFDYKLVWFIWALALFSDVYASETIKKLFMISTMCSLWLSYATLSVTKYFFGFYLLQPLGDIFAGINISLIIVAIFIFNKTQPKFYLVYLQNILNRKLLNRFL